MESTAYSRFHLNVHGRSQMSLNRTLNTVWAGTHRPEQPARPLQEVWANKEARDERLPARIDGYAYRLLGRNHPNTDHLVVIVPVRRLLAAESVPNPQFVLNGAFAMRRSWALGVC